MEEITEEVALKVQSRCFGKGIMEERAWELILANLVELTDS